MSLPSSAVFTRVSYALPCRRRELTQFVIGCALVLSAARSSALFLLSAFFLIAVPAPAVAQTTSTVCSFAFGTYETGWRSHTWTAADCSNGLPQGNWTGVGQGLNGSGTSGQVACSASTGMHYNHPTLHGATNGVVKCFFAPPAAAAAHPAPDVTTCTYNFSDLSSGWRTRYWMAGDCSNGLPQSGASAVGQGQLGSGTTGMVSCGIASGAHYAHATLDGASPATVTCTYVASTQVDPPKVTRCSYAFSDYAAGWRSHTWVPSDCSHGLPTADAWSVGQAQNGSGGRQMASCGARAGSHYNFDGATNGVVTCLFRNVILPGPAIDPGTGTYSAARTVTITPAAGPPSTVRYTLDGSTPTATSTIYSAPFTVNTAMTVNARSFPNDGSAGSAIATSTLNFNYGTLPCRVPVRPVASSRRPRR